MSKHTNKARAEAPQFLPTPLLITHWDPDLYPAYPIPLLQELIVHILLYGEVWIKEVDLFLNRRIRAFLKKDYNRIVFTSLVDTGRIKILVPDIATTLPIDRFDHPLLATAMSRHNKKPLKNKPWKLTDDIRKFCADLDYVFGRAGRQNRSSLGVAIRDSFVEPRVTPPAGENQFAAKLRDVLTQGDKAWKRRRQFEGITGRMADEFVAFCENHELAVQKIEKPNATNGFYRSLAYQCADLFPQPGKQAMKNLVQSVYAYCELRREEAIGTYSGNRLAEMPPDRETAMEIVRIEAVPLLNPIDISLIPNIGEVVSAVLEECESPLRVFWRLAGTSPVPHKEFQRAWAHVATAFAKYGAKYARLPTRPTQGVLRGLTEFSLRAASMWVKSSGQQAGGTIESSWAGAVTSIALAIVDSVRTDRVRLKRTLKEQVYGAAAIRCSRII